MSKTWSYILNYSLILFVATISLWSVNANGEENVKTFARFVPERADDFAWENDKVAFRVYGPAMRNRNEDSGVDCWLKRVDYPIINKWYKGNFNKKSYHRDHGEGYDPYHVGNSRGCGGLALWINDSLITSNTYTKYEIVTSEVGKTTFKLTYEWNYGADQYLEEKLISIKLGDRYFKTTSTFWKNGKIANNLPLAIGLATHDGKAKVNKDLKAGWVSTWELIDGYGLGTGIAINPERIIDFRLVDGAAKDDGHALIITKTNNKGQIEYIAGYGWEKAGEITSIKEWNAYLKSQIDIFDPNVIIKRMELAADWQIYNPAPYEDLEWHGAPFYMGLTDLYEVSKKTKYLEYLRLLGEKHKWKIRTRKYHADDHAIGLAYIKLYEHFKQPIMIKALSKEFEWILANPPEHYIEENGKVRLRYNRERWNWCDALYMAPPVWAGLGAVKKDDRFFDYMIQEWKQSHEWYWSEEDSLYFHDKRDIVKISPAGKKVFWARGDGWVHAGLVEVLQYLPEGHKERQYFQTIFEKMSKKLASIQKENGTWACSLLDEANPAQDDISGSVFYVYALAWGINNGILDRSEYECAVKAGWKALCERQRYNGRLINVQPVGGFPVAFNPETTAIFGVGGFISAGSEVWKLVTSN